MIRMENVSKTYAKAIIGISDVTLNIKKGEFAFIVGKSGSGKSTLMKLLLKELDPTSGNM